MLVALIAFTASIVALTDEEVPINPYSKNCEGSRKCSIAVCAIFKDEGPYLKEWIEYYQLIGVKRFYLYNNCSKDNYLEVLQPYIEKGIVQLFDVPFDSTPYRDLAKTHNFVQVRCYNHAISLARRINKWLAIIDTDEFICPVKDKSLLTMLKRYDYAPGLVVYWQIYGTSDVWDLLPNELMIEKLLNKFPENYGSNFLVKSIVQPKYATCKNPHTCNYKKGHAVNTSHSRYSHTPKFTSPPVDIVRINHYTYRTLSFYFNVKKPRRSEWGFNPSPEMELDFLREGNSVYDPVMMKFVPQLKERMQLQP